MCQIDVPISEQELQAIATSIAHRHDSLSMLVGVLQQVRAIRLDELSLALQSEKRIDILTVLKAR
jgi:hypothetical protein